VLGYTATDIIEDADQITAPAPELDLKFLIGEKGGQGLGIQYREQGLILLGDHGAWSTALPVFPLPERGARCGDEAASGGIDFRLRSP